MNSEKCFFEMFRQNCPARAAPSARYGLSRHRWHRRTATTSPEAEPIAPPRTRRRSKVVDCDDDAAASLQRRRRCKSYDNLNFSASMSEHLPFSEPVVTSAGGSATSAAAAERGINSAEGFGRRFRRSIRRISRAKVMEVLIAYGDWKQVTTKGQFIEQ